MAQTKAWRGFGRQVLPKGPTKAKSLHFQRYICRVKKNIAIASVLFILATAPAANAQCSLCTKTAQQLGEKPAQGLNGGILYLMMAPFAIVGVIGYRWWKSNR